MQSNFTVHCAKCNHQWDVLCPLPMSITRFVTVTKGATAAGCPSCRAHGKDVVLCGPATFTRREGVRCKALAPDEHRCELDAGHATPHLTHGDWEKPLEWSDARIGLDLTP